MQIIFIKKKQIKTKNKYEKLLQENIEETKIIKEGKKTVFR